MFLNNTCWEQAGELSENSLISEIFVSTSKNNRQVFLLNAYAFRDFLIFWWSFQRFFSTLCSPACEKESDINLNRGAQCVSKFRISCTKNGLLSLCLLVLWAVRLSQLYSLWLHRPLLLLQYNISLYAKSISICLNSVPANKRTLSHWVSTPFLA
jgi:hypothetical protein